MKIVLTWKIWCTERALKKLIRARELKPMIWSFGAYEIDPKHLVFVVGVPTDNDRNTLKNDEEFTAALPNLLERYNWPMKARPGVIFDIESQETVDRENDGNWFYHYK